MLDSGGKRYGSVLEMVFDTAGPQAAVEFMESQLCLARDEATRRGFWCGFMAGGIAVAVLTLAGEFLF